jgi:hypothetical protein
MCRVNESATRRRGVGFTVGLLTFLAAHEVEVLKWAAWFGSAHEPWFLNSGRAVAFTIACLFLGSLISGWLRLSGLMTAAGAATAMTLVLFLKGGGPGSIFPIVIAAGAVFILAVSTLGAWIGGEIRRVARIGR